MEPSTEYQGKTNEELILEYKKTGDIKLRQEIVLRYSYIVRTIAKQMYGVYVSFTYIEDIINEGILILMAALDKFSPERGVKFETYASLRVRGGIIDLARKQDWVPRNYRRSAKMIDAAEAQLLSELGRQPTDREMADYMGMDINKYFKTLGETNLQNVLSLESIMDSTVEGSTYLQLADTDVSGMPEAMADRNEINRVLKEAIVNLRENEQITVSLYYRKGLCMREIAEVLGVKEPRVSQIHANAIRKLRFAIENYMKE